MTGYPSFDNALKAIEMGAYDYLSKPVELQQLDIVVRRALETHELERLAKLERYRRNKEKERTVLIGEEGGLSEVKSLIELAASADAPVLITGETGTGKNVVASVIHHRSLTRKSGMISINCAALPEHLIEGELFGYEKGAFTGAVCSKRGLFETAHGGTIFLDEIGAMQLHLQSKLLSVLDDKHIRRLGDVTSRPVDVRIIAATNTRIEEAVDDGDFRSDLYYRLNVIRIHISPLRERPGDIPELCKYFLKLFAIGGAMTIPDHEMDGLMAYDWPGNVRELSNVLERAVLLRKGSIVRPSGLLSSPQATSRKEASERLDSDGRMTLEEVEKRHILRALRNAGGHRARAARILAISERTLYRKLQDYELNMGP